MKTKPKRNNHKRTNAFDISVPDNVGTGFLSELIETIDLSLAEQEGTALTKLSYLKSEIFSKFLDDSLVSPMERKSAAIKKFLAVEQNNCKTNQRLMFHFDDSFGWSTAPELLDAIRRNVAEVLGPFNYESLISTGNHTNGASTRVRRSPKAAVDKFSGEAHCSPSAAPHWFHQANSLLEDQTVTWVEESVMFTVPKKSDIDRVACKEPEINMYLQRSIGNYIRSRLKRRGIDLNDQSVNRQLAKDAVKRGLATIDLSSASDSVTEQLVFLLLPYDYWKLMDDVRVKSCLIPGNPGEPDIVHELDMFSSMGNGFTFELESLLFYAITRAVCRLSGTRGKISVYGDDIIAPASIVPRLKRSLAYLGFTLNAKKSFWTGGFRESCGGHYLNGKDISPFYIKGKVKLMTDLIRILNQLYEWDSRGYGFFISKNFAEFHFKWSKHVPSILHGGNSLERTDSLVTGDAPRSRIAEPELKKAPLTFTINGKQYKHYLKVPLLGDGLGHLKAWLVSKELQTRDEVPMILDNDAFLHYFRAEPIYDRCVEITHMKTGKPRLTRYPAYSERTTEQPYLLYGEGCGQ